MTDEKSNKEEIGRTQTFVLGRGFQDFDGHTALLGYDGTLRFFMELTADPDRPDVRPAQATGEILSSMQPGWVLRLLRFSWPDPAPRSAYLAQAKGWKRPRHEGLAVLYDSLLLFIESAPLPFIRRTILEFSTTQGMTLMESLGWWDTLPQILAGYGVVSTPLDEAAIRELAAWLFNPNLE